MVNEIININRKQEMKRQFNKIFKNKDPFGEVFTDTLSERLILYPTEGYYLTVEQYRALKYAAKATGDKEIFISEIESDSDIFAETASENIYKCKHWIVGNMCEVRHYHRIMIVLENAIYSPRGGWGIIISHEEHAVIGGTREFMQKFKENYKSWSEDMSAFNNNWEQNKVLYNSEVDWLPILVKHIDNNEM